MGSDVFERVLRRPKAIAGVTAALLCISLVGAMQLMQEVAQATAPRQPGTPQAGKEIFKEDRDTPCGDPVGASASGGAVGRP